jgi:hypothetical protein
MKLTFRKRDRVSGMASTHRFFVISISKYWHTNRTAKVIITPRNPLPTAR